MSNMKLFNVRYAKPDRTIYYQENNNGKRVRIEPPYSNFIEREVEPYARELVEKWKRLNKIKSLRKPIAHLPQQRFSSDRF